MGLEYQRTALIRGLDSLPGGLLLHDTFEEGPWWTITGTGGDDVHELSTAYAYTGAKSLKLKTRATNSANNDYIQVWRSFRLRKLMNTSFELMFLPKGYANIQDFTISIYIDTLSGFYTASFKYVAATNIFQYQNSAGTYVTFTTLAFDFYDTHWYRLAFDFDFANLTYNKFYLNHVEHDLSTHTLYSDDTQEYIIAEIKFQLRANAEGAAEIYIDQLFISETQ